MIQFSVLIPQRDRGDDVRRQLPELAAALEPLGQPYEIIVVDDGSQSPTLRLLEKLSKEVHGFRLLRLDEPGGVSAALSVAIQAARGETIIATEAGRCYPAEQIASLIEWLPRADMIVGRRRRSGVPKLRERIARIPRWLLLGLESHDPDCLFWAARREVFQNVSLSAGMARYLPALVARQGYRIFETYVEYHGLSRRLQDVRPNPGDLLAAWWSCRRWRNQQAYELAPVAESQPALRLVGADDASATAAASTLHRIEPVANTRQAKSA
jgi:glycosyltransferase involved in cell wall biosynthesis